MQIVNKFNTTSNILNSHDPVNVVLYLGIEVVSVVHYYQTRHPYKSTQVIYHMNSGTQYTKSNYVQVVY